MYVPGDGGGVHVDGAGEGDGAAPLHVDLLGADYFSTNRCKRESIETRLYF